MQVYGAAAGDVFRLVGGVVGLLDLVVCRRRNRRIPDVGSVRGPGRAQLKASMGLSTLSCDGIHCGAAEHHGNCPGTHARRKAVAVQTALGQPVNLVSYTIAGLVAPAIAFTGLHGEMRGYCMQTLQRCNTLLV